MRNPILLCQNLLKYRKGVMQMSFKKLLLQNDMKKPKIKQKNGKITIYVNYNEPISNENSNIRILLNTEYFKDRTFFHFIENIQITLVCKFN